MPVKARQIGTTSLGRFVVAIQTLTAVGIGDRGEVSEAGRSAIAVEEDAIRRIGNLYDAGKAVVSERESAAKMVGNAKQYSDRQDCRSGVARSVEHKTAIAADCAVGTVGVR